jgi:hypothetical protein
MLYYFLTTTTTTNRLKYTLNILSYLFIYQNIIFFFDRKFLSKKQVIDEIRNLKTKIKNKNPN